MTCRFLCHQNERRWGDPDFLWISDLVVAGHPLTPFQSEFVYQIVEARCAQKKPMLITINVSTSDEFNGMLGEATADRLRSNALTHFFLIDFARANLDFGDRKSVV